jgi:hypothetical protein
MVKDFEYAQHDSFFVTLYSNTPQADTELSRFMIANDGSNKIPVFQFPQFKKQIKDAGYTIRKAKKSKQAINDILAELMA